MPFFVIVTARAENKIIRLSEPLFHIGRSKSVCDFVLDHSAVSRMHLIVRVDGTKTFVADNHTRNGTRVNGEPLVGQRELKDGDIIEICGHFLEFHADEETEAGDF